MADQTTSDDPFLRRLGVPPQPPARVPGIIARLSQNAHVENGVIMGVSVLAAIVVLNFTDLTPPSSDIEMTYNGMTIYEFAKTVQLDPDDPYLIAMFEELCRSEDENAML